MRRLVLLVLLVASAAAATTRYVDGACATSGTGGALTCGAGGPFRTVCEGVQVTAPGDTLNVRGAHDTFDGVYPEYLGLWGPAGGANPCKAMPCTVANPCVIQGYQTETPILTGFVTYTDWTSAGSGVYFHAAEAHSEFTQEFGTPTDPNNPGFVVVGATRDTTRAFLQYSTTCTTALVAGRWCYTTSPAPRVYVHLAGSANPNAGGVGTVWVPNRTAMVALEGDRNWCPTAPDCPPNDNLTFRNFRVEGARYIGLEHVAWLDGDSNNLVFQGLTLNYAGTRYGFFSQRTTNLTLQDITIEQHARGMNQSYGGEFAFRLFMIRGGTLRNLVQRHAGNAGESGDCIGGDNDRPWMDAPWAVAADNPICSSVSSKILQSQNVLFDGLTAVDMEGGFYFDDTTNLTLTNGNLSRLKNGIIVSDWSGADSLPPPDNQSRNNVVRNCTFDDIGWNDQGALNLEPDNDPPLGATDFKAQFYNNRFTRVGRSGIMLTNFGDNPGTALTKVFLWNNTFEQDRGVLGYCGWSFGSHCCSPASCVWSNPTNGITVDGGRVFSVTNSQIVNNIFSDVNASGVSFENGPTMTGLTFDYNLYNDGDHDRGCAAYISPDCYVTRASLFLITGYEAHGVEADPRFVTPASGTTAGDLRLCQAAGVPAASCIGASPAIDVGLNVGLPFAGTAPDLGALETGSVPTTTTTTFVATTTTGGATTTTTGGGTTTTGGGTTTTTTLAGFPVTDTFNRGGPSLGPNWRGMWGTAGLNLVGSAVVVTATANNDGADYWTSATFGTDTTYACVQIGVTGAPTSIVTQAGACIIVNGDSSTVDAVCCDANFNTPGTGWQMDCWDAGAYHTCAQAAAPTFAVGDYIGIARIDTSHFQCFKALAATPTTWTDVSGVQVVSTVASHGNPGAFSYAAIVPANIQAVDLFEGGLGGLPTAHPCGVLSGTTTTTTGSGPTTTTTTGGPTTTTTTLPYHSRKQGSHTLGYGHH